MPAHTVVRMKNLLGESCKNTSILVLGVSYRQDVGDTRYSPVETLVRGLEADGAQVTCFDPFIDYWPEMDRCLPSHLPEVGSFDAVVLAIPHSDFSDLDLLNWLKGARPVILDTANVVSKVQRQRCRAAGIRIESVGRGDGL